MTRPTAGSLVLSTFLCYVLAVAFFLVLAIVRPPSGLLPSMGRSYTVQVALTRTIENMPALSVAGTLLAYTLFGAGNRSRPRTVQEAVRPVLAVLLTLTVGYMLADALAAPRLRANTAALEEASRRAHQYRSLMDAAASRADQSGRVQDWEEAREGARRYLTIDPNDMEMQHRENELHDSLLQARQRTARPAAAAGPATVEEEDSGAAPPELVAMAQRYYDEGDYYSAHYYASLALANPAVAPRASALVAAATAKIDPETPLQSKATPEEVAARRLAKDKRAAYEFFQREDWVTAYYEFGRLRSIYPDDTDIARFHDLALSRALASAFLIDEAREAMMEPGFTSLLFSERQENGIAVTAIGKMVGSAKGTYFEDVETLRYQPGKGPTLHVWARYGKLAGDGILLRALDPERREESEEPVVSLGEDTPDATILRSPERLDYLPYIKPGARSLRAVPAITLWGMRLQVRDSGVLAEALDLELLLFFVRPVLFLTLGLMGVGLAHRLRGRYYGRASPAAYSALALVPLALTGVWQLAADGARLLYGAVTAAAGLLPGAIAAAVVQSVLLVVALIGLSRSALE